MEAKNTPIVVAADFDDTGAAALLTAHELAARYAPATLHVVHVLSPGARDVGELAEQLEDTMTQLREHVASVLDEQDRALEADGAPRIEPVGHIHIGDPAPAILQCAVDVEAHMIVVGTHARRGLQKVVLGSVSEELLKIAKLPVVIARTRALDGLRQSDAPEPARPDQDMNAPSLTESLILRHVDRKSHIPGLV